MRPRTLGAQAIAGMAVAALAATLALAQPNGPPNALQGFSQNRDKPVKIDSASLEIRDKDKIATFAGNVHLVQGDTTLKCNTLVVFYEQEAASPARTASAGPAGAPAAGTPNQQIRRIEAKGNVIVTQKDQTATGDTGIFEMRDNKVMLTGNVVIAQGPNVVKGDRLVVDMTTGVSRVDGGRVQALIQPGSMKDKPEATGATGGARAGDKDSKSKPLNRSGLY